MKSNPPPDLSPPARPVPFSCLFVAMIPTQHDLGRPSTTRLPGSWCCRPPR